MSIVSFFFSAFLATFHRRLTDPLTVVLAMLALLPRWSFCRVGPFAVLVFLPSFLSLPPFITSVPTLEGNTGLAHGGLVTGSFPPVPVNFDSTAFLEMSATGRDRAA